MSPSAFWRPKDLATAEVAEITTTQRSPKERGSTLPANGVCLSLPVLGGRVSADATRRLRRLRTDWTRQPLVLGVELGCGDDRANRRCRPAFYVQCAQIERKQFVRERRWRRQSRRRLGRQSDSGSWSDAYNDTFDQCIGDSAAHVPVHALLAGVPQAGGQHCAAFSLGYNLPCKETAFVVAAAGSALSKAGGPWGWVGWGIGITAPMLEPSSANRER